METRPSSSAPIAHSVAASERKTPIPLASGRCGAATRNAAVAPIMATSAAKASTNAARLTAGSYGATAFGSYGGGGRGPRKLAGTQPGGANQTRILSRQSVAWPEKVEHGPVIGEVGEDRVECAEPAPDAVDRRLDLILVGAEQAIPDDENAAVILVEILVVDAVMHPVVHGEANTRSNQPSLPTSSV